jgi:hypothetical protein
MLEYRQIYLYSYSESNHSHSFCSQSKYGSYRQSVCWSKDRDIFTPIRNQTIIIHFAASQNMAVIASLDVGVKTNVDIFTPIRNQTIIIHFAASQNMAVILAHNLFCGNTVRRPQSYIIQGYYSRGSIF